MREAVVKLWPEIEWIQSPERRETGHKDLRGQPAK